MIPLNKPYISGNELHFLREAINDAQLSGNGKFTSLCQAFFESNYNIQKCLLTNSCTSALEMSALLAKIEPGDEVIVPSYTFVSSVNPFVLRGAKIVFADSHVNSPNLDEAKLGELITSRTKAIVVVHYAGISCNMDVIMQLADANNICVIEDAAHAQDAYYNQSTLGSIGHLGAFSFHSTKNITSGEGGLLTINDRKYNHRAEILWEKGTNRQDFLKGNVEKYEWLDIGSSFYPSELTAAFLWAQLEDVKKVTERRVEIWNNYAESLSGISGVDIPFVPSFAKHNGHLFYLKLETKEKRDSLIHKLNNKGIGAAFHYQALHKSKYFANDINKEMPNASAWQDQIIRLPIFYSLTEDEQMHIITEIKRT